MPDNAVLESMKLALLERFGEEFTIDPELPGLHELAKIAGHRSHRRYLLENAKTVAQDICEIHATIIDVNAAKYSIQGPAIIAISSDRAPRTHI
jgi:hypothetical protein